LDERTAIELELGSYALVKNENFNEFTINAWIDEFQKLQIEPFEVIKRIRLAKSSKKYGDTEFGTFMNVHLNEYSENYKHLKTEHTPDKVNYGYAVPLRNDLRDFKKERYEISDELPPDKESQQGYILLTDDNGYNVFVCKSHFRLIQG